MAATLGLAAVEPVPDQCGDRDQQGDAGGEGDVVDSRSGLDTEQRLGTADELVAERRGRRDEQGEAGSAEPDAGEQRQPPRGGREPAGASGQPAGQEDAAASRASRPPTRRLAWRADADVLQGPNSTTESGGAAASRSRMI